MAEYQRHPLARPHDVGQDFWAVNYAGPSLMDRQKYIDPRTGQVWESLEEALRFLREHVMPDITARDVNLPPGPPGEAAFRISQEVPTILPRPAGPAPVVTAVPEVSSGVPVQRDDISNWRVNQEHELRKALEREETEPELQSIDTSMLSRLIPSAQASDLAPLPPPQIGPTQIEPPEVGPSLLEPPPIRSRTIDLPGGKIVNGKLVLDESREAWKEFRDRKVEVPRVERTEEAAPESILDGWKEEGKSLLDGLESLNRDDILQNILGLLHPISAAESADNPLPYVEGYTPDTFLDNWKEYYWAGEGIGEDPKKKEWLEGAKRKMARNTVFPSKVSAEVSDAIDKAVAIFGGDYGKDKSRRYSSNRLRNDLVNTGWVESEYVFLTNQNGGSDSGYWQMQPTTAYNLLRSAKPHFYNPDKTTKFEKEFGSYHDLLKLSEDELKKKLRDKDEQDFAAALAAVKIITTFDY